MEKVGKEHRELVGPKEDLEMVDERAKEVNSNVSIEHQEGLRKLLAEFKYVLYL